MEIIPTKLQLRRVIFKFNEGIGGVGEDNSGLMLRSIPSVKTTSCSFPLISKGEYTVYIFFPPQLRLNRRCAFVRRDSRVTWSQAQSTKRVSAYLPLALVLGQVDLLEHLRPLFHHQGLLVGVGRDVAVVLRRKRHGRTRGDWKRRAGPPGRLEQLATAGKHSLLVVTLTQNGPTIGGPGDHQ